MYINSNDLQEDFDGTPGFSHEEAETRALSWD